MKFHFTTIPPKEKKKALGLAVGLRTIHPWMMTLAICQFVCLFRWHVRNTFCLANGPLRARWYAASIQKWAGFWTPLWPALGKSEAGATRPQLLGPTQLAYVRVDDSNITYEDNEKEYNNQNENFWGRVQLGNTRRSALVFFFLFPSLSSMSRPCRAM
ncbi:hypothetical protein EDB89DRAFT_1988996, partial [Lactarius sanguifluus]